HRGGEEARRVAQLEQALLRCQSQSAGDVIEHVRAAANPRVEGDVQIKAGTAHQAQQRLAAWTGGTTLDACNDGLRGARTAREIAWHPPGTPPGEYASSCGTAD